MQLVRQHHHVKNKEARYKEEYNNAVIKLLKNISMQNPELGRDIVMEALYKYRKDKEKWLNETRYKIYVS